jgi:hypothetical protein
MTTDDCTETSPLCDDSVMSLPPRALLPIIDVVVGALTCEVVVRACSSAAPCADLAPTSLAAKSAWSLSGLRWMPPLTVVGAFSM